MRQIILVRHAETAWNWPGRFYAGQYGPILTPAGESEATRGDRTA
ncbi:histidine phosphatase family protein [Streptomyces siamensis]